MRPCCLWLGLLASTVLLATTEAGLASTQAAIFPPDTLTTGSITTSRILKLNDDSDFNGNEEDKHGNEERGASTSVVETLTNLLKSPVSLQLDDLLKKGESADDVFKLFTLDKAADRLLASPHWDEWISYMKRFNKVNPTKRTTVIDTLTKHYGDKGLARIIEAAKQVRATAGLAKRVQTEQIQRWLLAGETPESIFTLLKLDDAGESLFTQSQVVTWAKFLDDFNKADPTSATTLFSFLKSRYDEDVFVKMLIAAKNVPSTEKIAIRIQAEQTALWLKNKKEPADIFKLLKLQDTKLPLLENPLFIAWDDVLAEMILKASKFPSTSDIAKRLFTEQMRNWYINKFAPDDVFKLLKLDQIEIPLFESSMFRVWTKFRNYYSDLRPTEDVSLLTVLAKVYVGKEQDYITIIINARKTPQTENFATQLLKDQLKRWLEAKTDPVSVFIFLGSPGAKQKDVRRTLYENYRRDFSRLPKEKKPPARIKP
ncbi:hypothetical protein PPTG_23692 [Phytophthora nicotianae INRA-310]|uniref:RxLR effector PexRD54 WY domain-containing protein n=1 Tax=Phytophthora nicotianae (strain INRA-310) TaxID=761204 RepID=W2PSY4_PHYN3|nr:hypothetical protein PPTG_23692 [Phytophthora nicotianae INRA-310]ETN04068.1 hypothetical protein PPTG_23692 [Phytophthora nicotianae INRA-310]